MIRSRLVLTASGTIKSSYHVGINAGSSLWSRQAITWFSSTLVLDESTRSRHNTNNNNNNHNHGDNDNDDRSVLLKRYQSMSQQKEGAGVFQVDPHQVRALEALERLRRELVATPPATPQPPSTTQQQQQSKGFLSGWFGGGALSPSHHAPMPKTPKGIYLHGK